MCIRVDANGCGDGTGTHVSVFVCLMRGEYERKLKRFLSKSKGCRVVKSTTGQQCKLTRNKHGMVTRLTC